MSGQRGPTKRKQTDAGNGLGSAAMERASMTLSIGAKISRRRSKRKAGMEGKEGKAFDGVDRKEGSAAMKFLKQTVEQDDEAYNKMGTGTAVTTPKRLAPKYNLSEGLMKMMSMDRM